MKTALLLLSSAAILSAANIYATFDVKPAKEAQLKLQSAGIIEKVNVDIGSVVKKGDLLLSLENSLQKAEVDLVKIELDIATTNAFYADKADKRTKKLKGVIDEAKADQSEQSAKTSDIQVELTKSKLNLKNIALEKTYLKAPFDGIITANNVEVGDGYGGVAGASAFTLQSRRDVKLILKFDEKYWKEVKVGDRFEFSLDGDDGLRSGVISKIYPTINSARMMQAEVLTKDIPVGLFGDGNIITK